VFIKLLCLLCEIINCKTNHSTCV